MSFLDWLYGRGGIPGNFDYGTNYIICLGVIFVLALIFGIVAGSRLSQRKKRIVLCSMAGFQLAFELFWRIVFLCGGNTWASLWPMYICNLNGILFPIAVLTNNATIKKLFYTFGFLGGLITFAMPQGIFTNAYLTFPILKSMLQHTCLLFIPVFEYVNNTYRQKLKDLPWALLGLCIHVVNSEGITTLLGIPGDYLYFNSGLPFVIEGVPGFFVVSITALIVLLIFTIMLDPHGFWRVFKKADKGYIKLQLDDGIFINIKKSNDTKRTE